MRTNEKQWPVEIVRRVASNRSKLHRKWTMDCSCLLLCLLTDFALVEWLLVGGLGSSFLFKCSFYIISWEFSLMCLFTWLPSLYRYVGGIQQKDVCIGHFMARLELVYLPNTWAVVYETSNTDIFRERVGTALLLDSSILKHPVPYSDRHRSSIHPSIPAYCRAGDWSTVTIWLNWPGGGNGPILSYIFLFHIAYIKVHFLFQGRKIFPGFLTVGLGLVTEFLSMECGQKWCSLVFFTL